MMEADELARPPGAIALVHRGVDIRRVIWILLVVLVVLGGVAAVGVAANERRKALPGGTTKALPAGGEHVDRTVKELRVGDVLTIDHRDFLVEGTVGYDEDGHRWLGGRCLDAGDTKWLIVGIERAGASATRLMIQDETTHISGYPPEAIVVGELRYALDKRGTATCELRGDVGGLGELKTDRPEGHAERCRWWLYSAPGDDTLLVEQWGADYRVLRGKKIHDGTVELMQGS